MVLRRESPQSLKGISRSKKKIVKSKLVYFDTRVPFIALKAYEALNSEMKSGRRIQLSEGDVVKKIQCLGNSNKRKGWTDILMFLAPTKAQRVRMSERPAHYLNNDV